MLETLTITEIAKIIIPGIIAFLTGRYFSNQSRDLTISDEEFNKVYLPMFKVVEHYIYKENINKSELLIVSKWLQSINLEYSHLVSEDLKQYIPALIKEIEKDGDYITYFDFVCFLIEKRYFKLKSILGYPVRNRPTHIIRHASIRRLKIRLKNLDLLLGEIFFIVLSLVLFVLLSQFAFNIFVKTLNFVRSFMLSAQ